MKIGIIGIGNMGEALLAGICKGGTVQPDRIFIHDQNKARLSALAQQYGVCPAESNQEVLAQSDYIFLMIKPDIYPAVLAEISPFLTENQILFSVAPGFTFARVQENLTSDFSRIVLFMSNTAAKIGQATTAACFADSIGEQEKEQIHSLFQSFGKFFPIKENQLPMITAVIGSSPAIVYMLLEGLLQAAIREGLPAADAQEIVANVVLSSAQMLLDSGLHPAVQRDRICSPGGTTIEGVAYLEKAAFTGQVIESVHQITKKALSMAN